MAEREIKQNISKLPRAVSKSAQQIGEITPNRKLDASYLQSSGQYIDSPISGNNSPNEDFMSDLMHPKSNHSDKEFASSAQNRKLDMLDLSIVAPSHDIRHLKSGSIDNDEISTPMSSSSFIRNINMNSKSVWSFSVSNNTTISSQSSIRVAIRVRPFSRSELKNKDRRIVSCRNDKITIVNPNAYDADPDAIAEAAAMANVREWAQTFRFNNYLWSFDTQDKVQEFYGQEDVYRSIGSEIVNNALNGVSCSCFAYGAPGSGKSYTLFGVPSKVSMSHEMDFANDDIGGLSSIRYISEDMGLIPRIFSDIIEGLMRKDVSCDDTKLTISFIEIRNEKIRDLLKSETNDNLDSTINSSSHFESNMNFSPVTPLKVREHPMLGPYVEGVTKVDVISAPSAIQTIYKGYLKRTSAQRTANTGSSSSINGLPSSPKSHAIITLELSPVVGDNIESSKSNTNYKKKISSKGTDNIISETQKYVRVQMVDLASSENDSTTPLAEGTDSRDVQQREAMHSTRKPSNIYVSGHFKSESAATAIASSDEKLESRIVRRSLSTLGYIIKSLSTNSQTGKNSTVKSLPYRDSVLTWLLKDALIGKNHIAMIGTISPAHSSFEDSVSTLKFAERLCLKSSSSMAMNNSLLDDSSVNDYSSMSGHQHHLQPQQQGEFSKLNEHLGATKPGSQAARNLLRETLSDPQQRIAKLKASSDAMSLLQDRKTAASAEALVVGDVSFNSLEALRDAYRSLHGQLVENAIELENARTDRDSLALELQGTKEAFDIAINKVNENNSAAASATIAYHNGVTDKEILELRGIISRKENTIERIMAEFSDEKKLREDLESDMKSQAFEYYSKFDELQKRLKKSFDENEKVNQELQLVVNEKNELQSRIQSLEISSQDISDNLRYEKELHGNLSLKHESLLEENIELKDTQTKLESSFQDFAARMAFDMNLSNAEKNDLRTVIEQQAMIIKLQIQQSETSLEMLNHRQRVLEKFDSQTADNDDELLNLQEMLQDSLSREGNNLHSELIDLRKIGQLLSVVRDRVSLNKGLHQELQQERNERERLSLKIEEISSQSPTVKDSVIMNQMEAIKKQSESSEARAEYWQQVAKKMGGGANGSATVANDNAGAGSGSGGPHVYALNSYDDRLMKENEKLRDDLSKSVFETKMARDELKLSQENMQKEFASLWMAVNELNKMDAVKDKEIQSLIIERDQALKERDAAIKSLRDLKMEYRKLNNELKTIDQELIAVAKAEAIPLTTSNARELIKSLVTTDDNIYSSGPRVHASKNNSSRERERANPSPGTDAMRASQSQRKQQAGQQPPPMQSHTQQRHQNMNNNLQNLPPHHLMQVQQVLIQQTQQPYHHPQGGKPVLGGGGNNISSSNTGRGPDLAKSVSKIQQEDNNSITETALEEQIEALSEFLKGGDRLKLQDQQKKAMMIRNSSHLSSSMLKPATGGGNHK